MLVLPILDIHFSPLISHEGIKVHIMQAFEMHGFLGAYLLSPYSRKPYQIHLVFDKQEVCKKSSIYGSHFHSCSELIIENPLYDSLFINNSYIIYTLNIPKEYHKDIDVIMTSRYSKVSKEYKDCLRVTSTRIANLGHVFTHILSGNYSYFIVNKQDKILKLLGEVVEENIPKDAEIYDQFDKAKETVHFGSQMFKGK